jgi:hypothetical protein
LRIRRPIGVENRRRIYRFVEDSRRRWGAEDAALSPRDFFNGLLAVPPPLHSTPSIMNNTPSNVRHIALALTPTLGASLALACLTMLEARASESSAARAPTDNAAARQERPPQARAPQGVHVVRSIPQTGAIDVSPDLEAIEIWFSEQMQPGGMSLLRLPESTKLGYRRDKRPYWKSPQQLVIPVRLQPSTLYGVGINGQRAMNFRSRSGAPCAPFELRFRTGEDAPPTMPGLEAPAGRWVQRTAQGRIEQWLFPDGNWALVRVHGDRRSFTHGTWKSEGERLRVRTEEGRDLPVQRWKAEGNTLSLRADRSDSLVRQANAASFADTGWLSAVWRTRWGKDNARTLTLNLDRSFTSSLTMLGRVALQREGRWEQRGLRLILRDRDQEGEETFEWCCGDSGQLELTIEGRTQSYTRQGKLQRKQQAPEQRLFGEWILRDGEGGTARLSFDDAGRYVRSYSLGADQDRSGGTYKVQGKVLLVHDDADDEDAQVPFEFVDPDHLALTIDGQRLVFERKGSESVRPPRATKLPAEILGSWSIADRTGSVRIVLTATGNFELDVDSFGKKQSFRGQASFAKGRLSLNDPRLDEAIQVPCRRVGPKLGLTFQGTELQLEKQ